MSEGMKLVPKLRFPEFREATPWVSKELGSVCEILNNRRRPITGSDREPGPYPYYGASGIVDFVKEFIFDERLLLVGEDGAKWNAFEKTAFIVEGKYWVNNHAHVLKPFAISDTLLENYLTMADLGPFVTGAAPPKLTLGKLKSIPVPVPQSSSEQQKIADCLSSLDELIAAQARKVDALKTHKKGLMQQLFPREGETQPRLRFPEFRDAGEWGVGPLSQFAQINPRREVTADDVEVSFVPMNSVSGNGYLALPQVRNYGLVKKGFTAFRDNDVILAKITPCFENGKAALVTELTNGIGFGSTEFHVVRANNSCLPEFIFAQIYSDQFRYLGKASMTGSGGQQRVPTTFVENYLLSVPSLAEQQRIADCLTSLDNLITAATQELETLRTHKKGLMQQLFPSAEAAEA